MCHINLCSTLLDRVVIWFDWLVYWISSHPIRQLIASYRRPAKRLQGIFSIPRYCIEDRHDKMELLHWSYQDKLSRLAHLKSYA